MRCADLVRNSTCARKIIVVIVLTSRSISFVVKANYRGVSSFSASGNHMFPSTLCGNVKRGLSSAPHIIVYNNKITSLRLHHSHTRVDYNTVCLSSVALSEGTPQCVYKT